MSVMLGRMYTSLNATEATNYFKVEVNDAKKLNRAMNVKDTKKKYRRRIVKSVMLGRNNEGRD